MQDLQLYLAILGTLAVLLIGLLFFKSQSSDSTETKTGSRRRAAIPNRDADGQIIQTEAPRGRLGPGRPRMGRRRQVQEEVEEEEPVEVHDEDLSGDDEVNVKMPAKNGKKKAEKLQGRN